MKVLETAETEIFQKKGLVEWYNALFSKFLKYVAVLSASEDSYWILIPCNFCNAFMKLLFLWLLFSSGTLMFSLRLTQVRTILSSTWKSFLLRTSKTGFVLRSAQLDDILGLCTTYFNLITFCNDSVYFESLSFA